MHFSIEHCIVVLRRRRSFAFLHTYYSGIASGAREHGICHVLFAYFNALFAIDKPVGVTIS